MSNIQKYPRGSEWRKWDLHIHTKDTQKNDQFKSETFDDFCVAMFKKALESNISAIGITDYFNIENYKKVKKFVDTIDGNESVSDQDKNKIKDIFILPNVELRMLPVTGSGNMINIHCLFNPDADFLTQLENDFFNSLEDSSGNKMNRGGLIRLGQKSNNNLNNDEAYKEGIKEFNIELSKLIKLFEKHSDLKEDTIIVVSNSSNDGVSGLQKHYTMFKNETGSLDEVRKNVYKLSDAIFSGNPNDREFFLGKKEGNSEETVLDKYGSLKPCIHGSDAHCEEKLFNPDENRYCWIKADLTFEGLKQIIYEPEHRVYIGEEPPILDKVRNNKTKYIDSLKINQVSENHDADTWFKDIEMPFNEELVAIIGNKGSGKSSIADILGLVGNTHIKAEHFSFLEKRKFFKGRLAAKFVAQAIWESGGKSKNIPLNGKEEKSDEASVKPESVRYIPQNYFEQLTNELEISQFQEILEEIIFNYIPDDKKLGKADFHSLKIYKTENVNQNIRNIKLKISDITRKIVELENKKHPNYIKKIEGFIENKNIEIKAQKKLLAKLPEIANPNNIQGKGDENKESGNIAEWNDELDELRRTYHTKNNKKIAITKKLESLKQMKARVQHQEQTLREFLENNENEAVEYGLDIRKILKVDADYSSINILIQDTEVQLNNMSPYFKSVIEIESDNTQENNISLWWLKETLQNKISTETKKLSSEQQVFQKNEKEKIEIEEKIKKLIGDIENPENETLNFYKKEKTFVEKYMPMKLYNKRSERLVLSLKIFNKQNEILDLYNDFKKSVDGEIFRNKHLLDDYDIKINSSFNLDLLFYDDFLGHINQNKKGTFYGKDEGITNIKNIIKNINFNAESDIETMLNNIITSLEKDQREADNARNRNINEQVHDLNKFYDFLFFLDYLKPKYELKLGDKTLDKLSPGERGALLLIFYLMIDKEDIPLIIDQPEDNLDNESVYNMLSKFIKKAKQNRQIIMVTHNPNLAVGADAEQIIHVNIDKQESNKFSFISGSIENPEINKKIVQILEGTKPAFNKRKLKYQ